MSRALHTFHGGIHPSEEKGQTRDLAITRFKNREEVVVPLNQGIRAVNRPIVEVGDRVSRGDRLSECFNPLSVPVHAPCNGIVTAIEERPFTHPSGMQSLAIVLQASGCEPHDTPALPIAPLLEGLSNEEIITKIRTAGVIGLGGAGFPTAPKLRSGGQQIETLILNGMECEPRITCDDRLMREQPEQIILGVEVLNHLLQPKEILIGIEDNKPEAIEAMRRATANANAPIEVVTCPTLYPSGGEKQLIQILSGKEVPSGGLPYQLGILCQNVATAHAIYRAVQDRPLTHRVITISGAAVTAPGNYEVAIGTPIRQLLTDCGVAAGELTVTVGGPMMGFPLKDLDSPVTKIVNSLIVEFAATSPSTSVRNCIRCASCSDVCPVKLLPQQLFWATQSRNYEDANSLNLFDCIECGCCSHVCPSHIPLVDYYRHAKAVLRNQQQEKVKAEQARKRHEFRDARILREKEVKARKLAAKKAALKAKEAQKKEAEAAAGEESPDKDEKKAAIAAAVARSKAKKAKLQQENTQQSTPQSTEAGQQQ